MDFDGDFVNEEFDDGVGMYDFDGAFETRQTYDFDGNFESRLVILVMH